MSPPKASLLLTPPHRLPIRLFTLHLSVSQHHKAHPPYRQMLLSKSSDSGDKGGTITLL